MELLQINIIKEDIQRTWLYILLLKRKKPKKIYHAYKLNMLFRLWSGFIMNHLGRDSMQR